MTHLIFISLEKLKSQAKSLLKFVREGDAKTIERFSFYFELSTDSPPKLHQAQLVIAREMGFDSWPKLKSSIEQRDAEQAMHHCSFCEKSEHEVSKLIEGPSAFICNECVDLCHHVITEEVSEKSPIE
jgi:hypothetical protein